MYALRAEEAVGDITEKSKTNRPANTTKSCKCRQGEYLKWCHAFCSPSPLNEVVDDRNSHLLLVTQVPYTV